jgi:NAD(P)H-flavin reductase
LHYDDDRRQRGRPGNLSHAAKRPGGAIAARTTRKREFHAAGSTGLIVGENRPQAPFGRRSVVVAARAEHGPYVVVTALDSDGPRPIAGQFYMLQTAAEWGGGTDGRPYLPRALSYARAAESEEGLYLDFLLEDVGPGTHVIANLEPGDELLLTGPFGNGFEFDAARRPVLVAGGIGLAPIVALDDEIRERGGVLASTLVGMRAAAYAIAAEHYGLEHELATEDGSAGVTGYVTELLASLLAQGHETTVYACGPPAMLEAVRALCEEHGVPSQLAMESGMACGFGACYGCVVPTHEGFTRLCVDGPVLKGDQIETAMVAGSGH